MTLSAEFIIIAHPQSIPAGLERSLLKKKVTRTHRRKERRKEAGATVGAPIETAKDRRRSERISTHIPAILLGKDAAGREFFDRSEIISVDSRGARVRSRFTIPQGTTIEVQLTNELVSKRMQVVWQGEPDSIYAGMVGLKFEDPNDSWNLRMLRARWESNS